MVSGKLITATPAADLLVEEIVGRYGSITQFCDSLRRDLDDPTVELPCIPVISRSTHTHTEAPHKSRAETDDEGVTTRTESAASTADAADDSSDAEATRRRGFWRRFLARWRP